MKNFILCFTLLIANFSYAAVDSSNQSFVLQEGKVEFLAIGRPSAIKIRGVSEVLSGQLKLKNNVKTISGEFQFDLSSLKTGIELRDDHMKNKYLEIEKHKNATLVFENIPYLEESVKDQKFMASLNLHGITKNIEGVYETSKQDSQQRFKAEFKIKVSDFGIPIPSYAGITVTDEVQVTVTGQLK
jgi:polyisoprenoid-binding protein YceI